MFEAIGSFGNIFTIAISIAGALATAWLTSSNWFAARAKVSDDSQADFRGEIRDYASKLNARVNELSGEVERSYKQIRDLVEENISCRKNTALLELEVIRLKAKLETRGSES